MYGYFGFEINTYYDDVVYDWGLVQDNIDIGYGGEMIMDVKAAPDGVTTGIIFVCRGGGVAVVLWWCLYEMILGICLFEW